MKRIAIAVACAAALTFTMPESVSADPARSCVKGAITGTVVVWVGALIASPFTGGASLAIAPSLDAVIWGSAIGCAAGMTGEVAADTLFPDEDE